MPIQRAKPRIADLDQTPLTSIANTDLPTGSVLQVKHAVTKQGSSTSVSNSASQSTQYGGNTSGRLYGLAQTVTITPTSSDSLLLCFGDVGWTSMAATSTAAHGAIITRNDGTDSIDPSDYPWYSRNYWTSSTPYWGNTSLNGFFTPSSTSAQTIRLRPYSYRESGTVTSAWRSSTLIVMEIAG